MNTSETTTAVAAAMVDAASALTNPGTDARGNYGTYASLPGIIDHVRPVLASHGLAVTQETITADTGPGARIGVVTRITHRSGEWLEFGPLWLMPTKPDPQAAGSAITYARRYALAAALGIAADEDDDGTAASVAPRKSTTRTPPRLEGEATAGRPDDGPTTVVDEGGNRPPDVPTGGAGAVRGSTDPAPRSGADKTATDDQWREAVTLGYNGAQVVRLARSMGYDVQSRAGITVAVMDDLLGRMREGGA